MFDWVLNTSVSYPQFSADLFIITKEISNYEIHFLCSVCEKFLMIPPPFFQKLSLKFLKTFIAKLCSFTKNEILGRDRSWFFRLLKFSMMLFCRTLVDSQLHFLEICLLTHSRRTASVVALSTCDAFKLTKQDLDSLLLEYPDMKPVIEHAAIARIVNTCRKVSKVVSFYFINPY